MAYGSVLTDVVQSSVTGSPPQFNDGAGTQTGTLCRAWINFNGTSGSVAARASFNVSSVTRTSAGNYTVTFTSAFSDTNYCCVMFNNATTGTPTASGFSNQYTGGMGDFTTTTINISAYSSGFADSSLFNIAVFR
jgi:hypothetical protein